MKKVTGYKKTPITVYVCDNCEKELSEHSSPIELDTTYYEYEDTCGNEYYFCSMECFEEYISKNKDRILKETRAESYPIFVIKAEFLERFLEKLK
jgi:YHS domain-containing protein